MLAEVYEELDDAETAISYLNKVRARAGVPDYEIVKNDPVYSHKFPTLKLAILHERRVELALKISAGMICCVSLLLLNL